MTEFPEFWSLLTDQEAADFQGHSRQRDWRRGAVIFRETDPSDSVVVLRTGRVKASSYTAGGTEVVLAVRGPGALLGELSSIDRGQRSATVTALEPVAALVMPLADFETYLATHGRVAYLLMRILAEKLRDADRKRIEFGAYDTTGRVAARLVELAERFGRQVEDEIHIDLPISQDELAGWIGASREAVSKALGVLRTSGWIKTSRLSVVVRDLDSLRDRAS
ncbi:MAG TPA: Crp/Fnr family transcriptional regulator [Micromonosporaceae bacterium]|nr:Crp/Fnr family transcriptional regulator [Micromonosporaceae bacterium]